MSIPAAATWEALGTSASVVCADPRALAAARHAVEIEVAAIDLACSRFREDSELSRVNDAAGGGPIAVGPLLLEAIGVALRAAKLTGGAVDPTVGQALILAGYDRDFASLSDTPPALPRRERVPGWRTVTVDADRGCISLPAGVRLDLGATAKALACDRAAASAVAATGAGVLVNLGGDIAMAGPAPAEGWSVRVTDDHRAPPEAAHQLLTLRGGGLATSSTTVRRWGPDRHHLIDPRTGRPAETPWRTVSVAAADCVDANVAATAAVVMGDVAIAWLNDLGLPARLVHRDGGTVMTAGWPEGHLVAA